MRIYNFSAYDRFNGASTRAFDISKGLVDLGYDVTFVTNDFCHFQKRYHNEREQINFGVKCKYIRTPSYDSSLSRLYNAYVNYKLIKNYQSDTDIDVVIGPSVPLTTGLAAYFFALRNNAKFVIEIRDVWPIALVLLGALSTFNPLYWMFCAIESPFYIRRQT